MANAWLRLYSEFSHDPKVQMMSEAMQRRYIMLMCLKCSNTLVTLHETEIAFHLRISDADLAETKELFMAKGFISSDWNLLNWDQRQFSSDSSRDRVAKHRALQKEKQTDPSNGHVTLHTESSNGTDTDTDTEIHLSSTSLPDCPQEALIDLYEKNLPSLPQPRRSLWRKGANSKSMRARWKWVLSERYESGDRRGQRMAESAEDALEWFDRYFGYVQSSDWLMGRDRDWNCSLGWLMTSSNFEKVLAGNYHKKAAS